MSLPWSKSVRLRVAPDSAWGSLEQGWLRPRTLARASHVTGASGSTDIPSATPQPVTPDDLSSAIDAVLTELGKTAALRGARLAVEWADSLMHFDVAAGDFAGDSDRQLQAVAVACVAELLGDAAQAHEVRWQLQADGQHLLIGAIARDHLRVLTEAAARHGLRLGSVQPDFCLQWNRHAAAMKPGAAVFAVACGHDAVVARVRDGAVATLSSGAWLDRSQSLGPATANVGKLMSGFGLEAMATVGVLDLRVDRLLASVGTDAASQASFVLVAPELSDTTVSARWTVLNREAPPA